MNKILYILLVVISISCGSNLSDKGIKKSELKKKIDLIYPNTNGKIKKAFIGYAYSNCSYKTNKSKEINLTTLQLHLNSGKLEKNLCKKHNSEFHKSEHFTSSIKDVIKNMIEMKIKINSINTKFKLNKKKYDREEKNRNEYQSPSLKDVIKGNPQNEPNEDLKNDDPEEEKPIKYSKDKPVYISSSDMGKVGVDIQKSLRDIIDNKMIQMLHPEHYPGKRIFHSDNKESAMDYLFETYVYNNSPPRRSLTNEMYLAFRAAKASIRWSKENDGIHHLYENKSVGILKFMYETTKTIKLKNHKYSHLIINENKTYREPKNKENLDALKDEVTPHNTFIQLLEIYLANDKEQLNKFSRMELTKLTMAELYGCPESVNLYGLNKVLFIKSLGTYKWVGPLELYNDIKYYGSDSMVDIIHSNVQISVKNKIKNTMVFLSESNKDTSKLKNRILKDEFDGRPIGSVNYMYQLTLGGKKLPPIPI